MLNQNEKLERFAAQVNCTADKSVSKIQKQTEKISNTQLQSFVEQAKQELNERMAYAKERLRRDANHAVAMRVSAKKQEAAAHREEIVDAVFSKAEDGVRAFAATADYDRLLESCVTALLGALSQQGATLFVRQEDLAKAQAIAANADATVRVAADPENTLGLARVESADGSIALSDTFESRLASARKQFLSGCGLSILP